MIKRIVLALATCAALAVTSRANAQQAETSRISDWSVGVGIGLLAVPQYALGAFVPTGFVSVERRLTDTLAFDVALGGHYSQSYGDYQARRGVARTAIGVRHFFATDSAVRPSAYLHGIVTFAREEFPGYADATLLAMGPEVGAALDADLSDSVVLRLEASALSLQRSRTWGDYASAQWSYGVGVSPRAELRIGF